MAIKWSLHYGLGKIAILWFRKSVPRLAEALPFAPSGVGKDLPDMPKSSDLCDKHKLHPTLFYQWQKAFFENGAAAFESRRPRSQSLSKEEDKIAALEAKLRSKTEVLAEVVEELVRTKKELGES